jgi:outer membrane protein
MNKLFFLGFSILTTMEVAAQPAALSLQQSVETAFANNPTVKQSEFLQEAAGVNLSQAKGNFIPRVNGSINHYLNQGRSIDPANNTYINQQNTTANYSLSSDVTLFNGLLLLNNLRKNQYAYEASRMEWQQAKDKLMLDVVLAYLQMLTNTDLLEQARRQSDVTKQQVDRLFTMNKEGAIKPSDYSDLRGQYANDQLAFINAQNALDQARYTLSQLMNVPYNRDLTVTRIGADQFDMNYGSNPDSIYEQAIQQLAIVKAAELRTKSVEKALRAAKGNLYPSLGLGGGINTNYSSLAQDATSKKIPYDNQLKNNYGTYIGAGITIPILNNFRYKSQVALAKIDYKSAQFTSQTVKIQLKQNIEKDFFNMTAALDRYKALNEQVNAYTESFQAADIRFTEGVGTSVDYLIAKNNLDRAKTNLIVARYEYLLRIKILDFYQSRPLW